jgi:hypothetical protein
VVARPSRSFNHLSLQASSTIASVKEENRREVDEEKEKSSFSFPKAQSE